MTEEIRHVIINNAADLERLCKQIDDAQHFALDLEFIPERTYVPQLCLVQVCVGGGSVLGGSSAAVPVIVGGTADDTTAAPDTTACIIDPLQVRDLMPLWQRVADPNIAVSLHAGEQDLSIIHHLSRLAPSNILDTQIAAGFLGFGYPIGYGKLLQQLLGVNISKTETFTDWMRRPLTDSQIEYALNDVRHLPAMERKLKEMLSTSDRLMWVIDECTLRYKSPRLFQSDPDRDLMKIKGARALPRRNLAVLRELLRFREAHAAATNRPPQKIISDMLLLELARRPIKQIKDMEHIRGMRSDYIAQYGDAVLGATAAGLNLSEAELPQLPIFKMPSRSQAMKTDVLLLLLKALCHTADLAPDLVATRADIEQLVRVFGRGDGYSDKSDPAAADNLQLLQGWRKDLVGCKLLDVLGGSTVTLRLSPDDAAIVLELGEHSGGG